MKAEKAVPAIAPPTPILSAFSAASTTVAGAPE
jgi:hypothetical protein